MLRKTWFGVTCLMLVALFFLPSVSLTAGENLGFIEGNIRILGGDLPLPGIRVTVASESLGVEQTVTADENGKFRISDLPPADDYQIVAALEGYEGIKFSGLTVTEDGLSEMMVVLKSPNYQSQRRNRDLMDSGSSSVTEEFIPEFLDDIPNGRTYLDAVSMVAGVAGLEEPYHRKDDNLNHAYGQYTFFHVHGGDSTDNAFLVNGLETTDTASGRGGMHVPWEAIESVEVLTGGMPAEYGRATGGIVNVQTKSGGSKFHGSVPVYYTDLGLEQDQDEDRGAYLEDEYKELEWGASVGGPVLTDRMWFFGTYNRFTRTTEGISAEDDIIKRDDTFQDGLFNMTWQVNPDNKLRAEYADNSSARESRDSLSSSIQPSAYAQEEVGDTQWQLQWTSIFTPNLFFEAHVGQHEATHTIGPANAGFYDPRFVDQQYGADTIIYGNVSSISDVTQPRMQYKTALNYYVGDWAGEHNLKFGAEYQDLEFGTNRIYPDAYTINRPRTASGSERPDQWIETSDINYLDTGKIVTLYAQDSWTWHENWTFNLGLRWEQQEQKNDVGEQVYSFDNLLSPRIGAAWDISGDGSSRLFAHYGRYHQAVGMLLAATLNRQFEETWRYEGNYETDDWEEINHTVGYENPTTVDEDLEPNVKDEFILGYEFVFLTDFVAGARFIYNQQDNLIEDVLSNEDEIRYGYDNQYLYHITNVQSAERKYRGLELSCKKRLSNNYQFFTVLTISQAKGSVSYEDYAEGLDIYADFEEMTYNRYGYLPWDDKQYLKINGSYHLPWGIIVGASLNWRSGRPYNRIDPNLPYEARNFGGYTNQYFLDPRGSHRMGSAWWLDLRLRKDFEIGPTTLSLTADAFNLTNNQTVIGRSETDYYHGLANSWMQSGYFVLGGRFSF